MAVKKKVGALELGRDLAKIVKDEPLVKELWVSDNGCCKFHLWLIVEPLSLDEERDIFALVGPLWTQFPDVDFMVHPLNPNHFLGDTHQVLPQSAKQLPLHDA
jgi:hypothetical protein